jgi:hypothetical protein
MESDCINWREARNYITLPYMITNSKGFQILILNWIPEGNTGSFNSCRLSTGARAFAEIDCINWDHLFTALIEKKLK